jgi:quercetin dioxygenase-like cupin family protein
MTAATASDPLWFLDTLVRIPVAHGDGADGLSVVDSTARRGDSPPLHVHHTEDEVFHVVEGDLRLRVGDVELRLGAGGTARAPKRVAHTYRVESERARWLAVTTRGDFERLVRSLARAAAADGLPAPSDSPTGEERRSRRHARSTGSSWSGRRSRRRRVGATARPP